MTRAPRCSAMKSVAADERERLPAVPRAVLDRLGEVVREDGPSRSSSPPAAARRR